MESTPPAPPATTATTATVTSTTVTSPECGDGYEPIENKVEEISIGIQTDPAPEYDASVVDIAASLEDRITEIFQNAAAQDAKMIADTMDIDRTAVQDPVVQDPAIQEPHEITKELKPEAETKAEEESCNDKPMMWSAETSPDDGEADPAPVKKDRSKKTNNAPKTDLGKI